MSSHIGSSQPPELPEDPRLFGSHEFLRLSNESVENLREFLLLDGGANESLRSEFVDPIESRRIPHLPGDNESLLNEDMEDPRESLRSDDMELARVSFLSVAANPLGCSSSL